MEPLFIQAPWGLGDTIYARPLIAQASSKRDLYVETPWPELFADLAVKPVLGSKGLRTQTRNLLRQPANTWHPMPPPGERVALGYGPLELETMDIYSVMASRMPWLAPRRPIWTLPDLGECPIDTRGAPLAVVRPVVRRREWDNAARNPLPEYIELLAGDLQERGFAVVVICDLSPGEEWLVSNRLPPHDAAFTQGEMDVRQLLATVRDAAVVVGGVGWIVPAAAALGTPTFVVLGGNGGMNSPTRLINRRMDAAHIGFAMPEAFCQCTEMHHDCPKWIPDLAEQWSQFWKRSIAGRLETV